MEDQNYEKLKELLKQNTTWPLLYMFKFIVPNSENKVERVAALLPKAGTITYNHTKNLKFVSVTCKVYMNSVEEIINVNQQVDKIAGVMSL